MASHLSNPWYAENIQDFTFICCPECVYRTKEEQSFQAHAISFHPQSYVFFDRDDHNDDYDLVSDKTEVKDEPSEEPSELKQENIEITCDPEVIKNESFENDSKPFSCEKCDLKFSTERKLINHVKIVHEGVKERIPCTFCDEVFASKNEKQRMKRIHPIG